MLASSLLHPTMAAPHMLLLLFLSCILLSFVSAGPTGNNYSFYFQLSFWCVLIFIFAVTLSVMKTSFDLYEPILITWDDSQPGSHSEDDYIILVPTMTCWDQDNSCISTYTTAGAGMFTFLYYSCKHFLLYFINQHHKSRNGNIRNSYV